jgi:hypothetical protein
MTTYPTAEAWNYFTTHLNNIRDVVEQFLPVPQWQSMVGPFGSETDYTIKEFDQAVFDKNTVKLSSIMNDAWGRTPEDRDVYCIPGFTEMCNLLDCTVDGFVDNGDENVIEEQP